MWERTVEKATNFAQGTKGAVVGVGNYLERTGGALGDIAYGEIHGDNEAKIRGAEVLIQSLETISIQSQAKAAGAIVEDAAHTAVGIGTETVEVGKALYRGDLKEAGRHTADLGGNILETALIVVPAAKGLKAARAAKVAEAAKVSEPAAATSKTAAATEAASGSAKAAEATKTAEASAKGPSVATPAENAPKVGETSAARGRQGVKNKQAGTAREKLVGGDLVEQYPNATVNAERLLLNSEGVKVLDPLTGTGRRIDFVLTAEGVAVDSIEVTSKTANKSAQIAKEMRIRAAGGTYIKDRVSGKLVDVSKVPTRIVRKD